MTCQQATFPADNGNECIRSEGETYAVHTTTHYSSQEGNRERSPKLLK